MYFQQIIQYRAGREPVIISISSANLQWTHLSLYFWACKRVKKKWIPFDSIDISHGDAFKESNYQKWVASCETVHQLKYVAAGTMREYNWYCDTRYTENLKENVNCYFMIKNSKFEIRWKPTPMIMSFGKLGNSFISTKDVARPSSIPNCESMPSVNSIRKKRTAQNCAPGNWLIASVKIMNANPVPDALCFKIKPQFSF